jgi:hypothetical protein
VINNTIFLFVIDVFAYSSSKVILAIAEFPTSITGDSTLIEIYENGNYSKKYGCREWGLKNRMIVIDNRKEPDFTKVDFNIKKMRSIIYYIKKENV